MRWMVAIILVCGPAWGLANVEFRDGANTVLPNAVHIEAGVQKGAVEVSATGEVQPGAVRADGWFRANAGAVRAWIERGAAMVASGAVQATVADWGKISVEAGAVPVTANVSPNAVNLTLAVNVAPGAVQVTTRGIELDKGVFDGKIVYALAALCGVLFLGVMVLLVLWRWTHANWRKQGGHETRLGHHLVGG